jgi:hypothetical protein
MRLPVVFFALALFFTPLLTVIGAEPVISEFMANNERTLADEDGDFPDWIEIHNPGATATALTGYYLTDDQQQLAKWAFPTMTMPAGGYVLIFASGKNRTNDPGRLHASFQLNAAGGFLALVKPDGVSIVSGFTAYPEMKADVAYGFAETVMSDSLLANSAPRILVPANGAQLPASWNTVAFAPGIDWSSGSVPPAMGYDTNQATGLPVNVARSGTAAQSTTLGSFTPNLGINNNLGDFTHTLGGDTDPFWQVTLTNEIAIYSIVLHNRTSCCGSRLRDITIEILSTTVGGAVTNWTSSLLNPENSGFAYPNGPASISNNLVTLTGGPVPGRIVRVRRTPDPDLSGTGGQGNTDEPAVLSLGEVVINGTAASGLRPFFNTDLQAQMLGRNASAFVRMPFTSASTPNALTLRVRYDDGFIAYLNGVEVARRNAPAGATWDSAATLDRNLAAAITQESIDLPAGIPLLAPGPNLLAVQALNFSASDSDLLLQPELIATRAQITTNVFLTDATPGSANTTEWYYDEVADTRFSVDRGFFEAPFSLSITSATPDAVIYYSFNCDEPAPGKGALYTGPITITNTTVVRVRAFKEGWKPTDVDTATYLFLGDVIYQSPDWPATRVPPPYFPSSWGANSVDYGMDPNVVSKYSQAEWKEALTQIPTMSVVTEMPNLFDPATGIYANAQGHGEVWERPASLELIDPASDVPGRFQENCGLRIRGGFSRNPQFVKHSFRVFFRREYGAGKLNYPLFEDEGAPEFETFDLRTSQNYSWPRESNFDTGRQETMVREVFCRETLGAMGQPYRRSRYYHLYVNGHYWGVYETDERPEASYGQTYFGGSKTNYDVVKCGNRGVTPTFATEATDGNLIAWSNLWTMCQSMRTNAANSNYFRILGRRPDGTRDTNMPVLLDVDNLIDYMLEIFYSGDGDATLSSFLANNMPNNWFGMRDRTNPDVGFRFFNSDCEHTLGSPNSAVDRTGPFGGSNEGNFLFSNPQWMHEELMRNQEYRLRFADHVQKHFFNGGALMLEPATNRFLRKAAQINRAMRAMSARWGDAVREPPYGEAEWTNMINFIVTNWFPPRANIVLAQLRADALFSSIGAPAFGQLGGTVPEGYELEMAHTNTSGVILFTTDGSDPRMIGGGVSPSAQSYLGPVTINATTLVRARVLTGTNWSAIIESTFYPPQDLSKLLITEIMYHPPTMGFVDSDEFEFLELKNAGTNTLTLSGLSFTSGITFSFTNGTTLAPGQFFVLVRNQPQFAAKYPGVTINGIYSGRLDNGGELLTLSHSLGSPVLSLTYDDLAPWPIGPDDYGFSLVPTNPDANFNPDNAVNWRASGSPGGSPGADDPDSPVLPILLSEVLSHSETGVDFIELFNPNAAAADIGGWFLTDDPGAPKKYRIPDGTLLEPLGYLVFDESQFNASPGTGSSFSLSSRGESVYLFSGDANTNLTGYSQGFNFGAAPDEGTFGRYVISTGEEHFPQQVDSTPGQPNSGPRIGPIVINEIMYHPDTGGDEFIELKNITTNAMALYDPAHPANTWKLAGLGYSFPTNVVAGPEQLLLLVATDPSSFRMKYGIAANVKIIGPYPGALQDGGERLELQRPDVPDTNGVAYVTVDEARYNDKAPWPAAADGSGPSLQRKNSAAYGNDPANWEAALATPGAEFVGGQSPTLLVQPRSQTVLAGDTVLFSVSADGPAPLNYKWRFNGNDLPGANSSTLELTNVRLSQAGSYTAVVFNNAGSVASAAAVLTVRRPPVILAPPTNQFVRPGNAAVYGVTATGNGILRYQWRVNGTDIPGATSPVLTITNAQFENEGEYTVTVSDSVGPVTTTPVRLIILVDPIIAQQPLSQSVALGATVTLSIGVTNTATLPIGYRLRRNNLNLWETFVTLSDRTAFFTITNARPPFTNYTIVATNAARTVGVLSAPAILTILSDADGDGIPDVWEATYNFETNNVADAAMDADGDTMSNWAEYVAGTDPTDSSSYLKIDLMGVGGGAAIEFPAVSNKTYRIDYTDALGSSPWSTLASVPARATNRLAVIMDFNATTNRFYRLGTPHQP